MECLKTGNKYINAMTEQQRIELAEKDINGYELLHDDSENVRAALAKHRKYHNYLMDDTSSKVKIAVAKHTNDKKILMKLVTDADVEVRYNMAMWSTDENVIGILRYDQDKSVRIAIKDRGLADPTIDTLYATEFSLALARQMEQEKYDNQVKKDRADAIFAVSSLLVVILSILVLSITKHGALAIAGMIFLLFCYTLVSIYNITNK